MAKRGLASGSCGVPTSMALLKPAQHVHPPPKGRNLAVPGIAHRQHPGSKRRVAPLQIVASVLLIFVVHFSQDYVQALIDKGLHVLFRLATCNLLLQILLHISPDG